MPIRDMYLPGMPGTKRVIGVFTKLGQQYLPRIWTHLQNEGIHPSMYATEWFMTLFTSSFPFHLIARIFDVLWYEGFDVIYRVALGSLKVLLLYIFEVISYLSIWNPHRPIFST